MHMYVYVSVHIRLQMSETTLLEWDDRHIAMHVILAYWKLDFAYKKINLDISIVWIPTFLEEYFMYSSILRMKSVCDITSPFR